jgi:hypothetical protein
VSVRYPEVPPSHTVDGGCHAGSRRVPDRHQGPYRLGFHRLEVAVARCSGNEQDKSELTVRKSRRGGVTQLEECDLCKVEVVGSSPITSTNVLSHDIADRRTHKG